MFSRHSKLTVASQDVAIVIIPATSGHFLDYGIAALEACLRQCQTVIATLPNDAPRIAIEQITSAGATPTLLPTSQSWPKSRLGQFIQQLSTTWEVAKIARGAGARMVFCTYVERLGPTFLLARLLMLFGDAKTVTITMRLDIGQHEVRPSFLKRCVSRISLALASKNHKLITNDPVLYSTCQRTKVSLFLLKDYSECRPTTRADSTPITILLIGAIDARKGLERLVSVAKQLAAFKERVSIRVVGAVNWDSLPSALGVDMDALCEIGILTIIDRRVSSEEYRDEVANCDVVWAAYKDHQYSSGLVVDAICAKKIVICQNGGVIGWYAKRYDGAVISHSPADDLMNVRRSMMYIQAGKNIMETKELGLTREDYVSTLASTISC